MTNLKEARSRTTNGALVLMHDALRGLPQDGQVDLLQIRGVLDAITQPKRLRGVIESVLGDANEIRRASDRSFGHITGMERIELASEGDYSLRVHFWMPSNGEVFTEDPHSHIYNFASKILSGTLVTDLYEEGDEGDDVEMYRIASQNSQLAPIPEFAGMTKLRATTPPLGLILSDRDPSYTMTNKVIHRTRQRDPSVPIITLNLRAGDVKDRSTFYREPGLQKPTPNPMRVDVKGRLNLLLDKLAA